MQKKRLLSGIQSTGKMHLGNYLGAVSNWIKLQDEYDSFFMIADLHSLTTTYEKTNDLKSDKFNLAVDLLAAGIDPTKSCLFYQSDIPGHSELFLLLSMVTPLPWLTRVPSYKSKISELKEKDLNTYGFLGYPVLQAADILLYKGEVVPVGKDQLPHLELAREIARRFNYFYQPIFPEPSEKFTNFPILPGLDGQKMSKSYQNTIPISASPDHIHKLVLSMFTDPSRQKLSDPGHPEICPVFAYHKIFNNKNRQQEIASTCQNAQIGCVACKKEFAHLLTSSLADFHQKRKELLSKPKKVNEILAAGAAKASRIAEQTIKETKEVIGL
jgi:tryptophanyl-tRNA synthetase